MEETGHFGFHPYDFRMEGVNSTNRTSTLWTTYCGDSDTELHSCLQSSVASVSLLVVLGIGATLRVWEMRDTGRSRQPGVLAYLLFGSICLTERRPSGLYGLSERQP